MGSALSTAWLGAGFEVRGYDIHDERRSELGLRGGLVADSALAAVEGMSIVVTSLPTSAQVREVFFGPDGIASQLLPGTIVIDTTTSRPEDSVALAAELGNLGVGFVDAGLSGSSSMVSAGDLVAMVGGSAGDVESSLPVLEAVARSVHYMGPVGAGAMTKLVVNLVLGGNRLALAEGLLLASRAGLDTSTVLDVLLDGAAYSKAIEIWGPRMVAGAFDPPSSRILQHHKDVKLILEQGERLDVALSLTRTLNRVLVIAESEGFSEGDISNLITVLGQIRPEEQE